MGHPEVPEGSPEPDNPDGVRWSRSDLALARRAIRQRWGVPDEVQTEVLWQAASILADPEADTKHKLAAMRLLVAADRADILGDRLYGKGGMKLADLVAEAEAAAAAYRPETKPVA